MVAMLAGGGAVAQPANHIGQALADVFVAAGCTMTEVAASEALQQAGAWTQSDVQAQMLALYRGGSLVSTGDGRLQLRNWPPCG